MDILPIPEKQREPSQSGGWQKDMARRRYQNGCIRKRGKRNPVWELLWWEDFIKEDGNVGRRLASKTLGAVRDLTRRQAKKLAEEHLRPLNLGRVMPLSTITLGDFVKQQFVPNVFPVLKTLNPGSLSPHLGQSHFARSRCSSPLRYRDAGSTAVHTAESRHWPELGLCRSLSPSAVEDLFHGKEVGLLLGRKSCRWSGASRKEAGSGKACPHPRTDFPTLRSPSRTCPYHVLARGSDRSANWGSSRSALERHRPRLRAVASGTSLLPRPLGLSQNPRQQAVFTVAAWPCGDAGPLSPKMSLHRAGRSVVSELQRQTAKRHQFAPSTLETCRSSDRSTLAELAHAEAHPRHAGTIGGRLPQRCSGTTRYVETLNQG